MNPNSQIANKKDLFKKQIRKEQIEKKKVHLRKALPYYQIMFPKSDDDSNATNSRSSRFPVPSNNNKNFKNINDPTQTYIQQNQHDSDIDNQLPLKQSQLRYLDYLRNLGNLSQEERKQKIDSELSKKFASDHFNQMDHILDSISVSLMECESELMDYTHQEELDKLDWGFILAVLYLAENQNLTNLQQTCFNLMTNYFIPWLQASIQSQIVEGMSLQDFMKLLAQEDEDLRIIEDVILSQYISLTKQSQLNEKMILNVIKYFNLKFKMFEDLEHYVGNAYQDQQQTSHFCEIIYDFPSLYFVQSLAQNTFLRQTSTQMKISTFILLNKYFTGYPLSVESDTENDDKFTNLLSNHLNKQITFFKLCLQVSELSGIGLNYITLIESGLELLSSVVWRDLGDVQILIDQVIMFTDIVNSVVKLGITSEIVQYLDIHVKILEFFVILTQIMDSMKNVFESSEILDYLNSMLFQWHSFKLAIRKEGTLLDTSSETQARLIGFEFYLIQSLDLTKRTMPYLQLTKMDQQWVGRMFEYAEVVYEKERSLMINLRKIDQEEIIAKDMFLFQNNINHYFNLMKNTKYVFNPETTEQYAQQDVEI